MKGRKIMKKKILSIGLASAMLMTASGAVLAEDQNNPSVYVDDALITFADQPAVIKSDRTLVPARGVFEAMGAKVEWEQESQTVTINSSSNTTRIILTIDNPTMTVYTFSSLLNADKNEVTLDVAPQILNDRTMIPLRAISEALNADVDWNAEEYKVDITTKDKPESKETLPTLSLVAPKTEVKADEEFDIYVNLANIKPETWVSAVTAGIEYDKENFEFVSSALCNAEGTVIENSMIESNSEFSETVLKTVAITIDEENAASTDGYIMKLTFKALSDKTGSFSLTNGYHTLVGVGYDTTLLLTEGEVNSYQFEGNTLNIDTTPVVINAAAAE